MFIISEFCKRQQKLFNLSTYFNAISLILMNENLSSGKKSLAQLIKNFLYYRKEKIHI